ncbi:MAG: carbon-nitrogen hydrolase family protein [Spirochaetes bacterium]|nr:carbon-nitrogen hydrolase family protein [Spirochaetota bacterium]
MPELEWPRQAECIKVLAFWGPVRPEALTPEPLLDYDALLPEEDAHGALVYSRRLTAPEGCEVLTLRFTLRWVCQGEVAFHKIELVPCPAPVPRKVKIALATGSPQSRRQAAIREVAGNRAYYLKRCEEAARLGADLIVLPEIALQWGVPGHFLDLALRANDPEIAVFLGFAKREGVHLLLPVYERTDAGVHNSALFIGPDGLLGTYRKMHLAECGESHNGILPGIEVPVFETPVGRLASLICMDSSSAEASRLAGLAGAELLMLPIMGDHRADRQDRGSPFFHEERWKAIMRTRALDNQFVMAVARNEGHGSCLIDARGEILAWNDGTKEVVCAEAELDPGNRKWNGGSQRDIVYTQRRPHLYGSFTEPAPAVVRGRLQSS